MNTQETDYETKYDESILIEKVYNNFPVFEKDEVKVNGLVKKCVIEDQGLY